MQAINWSPFCGNFPLKLHHSGLHNIKWSRTPAWSSLCACPWSVPAPPLAVPCAWPRACAQHGCPAPAAVPQAVSAALADGLPVTCRVQQAWGLVSGSYWAAVWKRVPSPARAPGCDLYLQGCHFLAASELGKVLLFFQLMFTVRDDETTQVKQMQTSKVLE